MWIAYPWRMKELPEPHMVDNPSMKSIGESGASMGFHLSWVGLAELLELLNSLKILPLPGTLGLNGSWVTDGLIR